MNEATNPAQNIHASAVVVGEAGVLIRGRSGRGKSALALALIELARERGLFGRLIGDDRVLIEDCGDRALLSGAPKVLSRIERRGYGLESQAFEKSAVARLVVDLLDDGVKAARMPEPEDATATIGEAQLERLVFDEFTRPFERARTVLWALGNATTAL
jgi:serine kinase of HPr protein (carbohydrate metabolism regulator)